DWKAAQVEAFRLEGEEEEPRAVGSGGGSEGRSLGAGERDGRIARVEGESPEVDEAAQAHGGVDGAAVGAPGGGGDGAFRRRRQLLRSSTFHVLKHQAPDALAVQGVGDAGAVP